MTVSTNKISGPLGQMAFQDSSGTAAAVAQKIMEEIRHGVWKAGEKLPTERKLAMDLGISRSSLREALRALEVLGLLQVRQGSGVFVSSLDPQQLLMPLHFFMSLDAENIEALFEARISLESAVAGLAAERATDQQLSEMRALLEGHGKSTENVEKFIDVDVSFHRLIAQAANNPILERMVQSLDILGRASREITGHVPGILNRSAQDHRMIMQALETREPSIAQSAMAAHLRHIRDAFREGQKNGKNK